MGSDRENFLEGISKLEQFSMGNDHTSGVHLAREIVPIFKALFRALFATEQERANLYGDEGEEAYDGLTEIRTWRDEDGRLKCAYGTLYEDMYGYSPTLGKLPDPDPVPVPQKSQPLWFTCRERGEKPHQCNFQCAAINQGEPMSPSLAEKWWDGHDFAINKLKEKMKESGLFDDE